MGFARKLKEVNQALGVMTTQSNLAHFLNNPENAQRVDSLVEDICYTLMEYQVCTQKGLAFIVFNTYLRVHYDRTSTTRAAKRL